MKKSNKRKPNQLPSGHYRVKAYLGINEDGKKVYKSFTAKTKSEAELQAKMYKLKYGRGIVSDAADMTLEEAYVAYIDGNKDLSPTTVVSYRQYSRNSFQDIMHVKLSDLTQERIQLSFNLYADNHSAKSASNAHGLLSAVLKRFHPGLELHTRLKKKKRPNIYVPTTEDIRKLLNGIKGTELEKAVMLAAFGGLRRSEICALTADDIDRDEKTIKVNKALVKDQNGIWILKEPKTEAGKRILTIPEFVLDVLPKKGRIISIVPESVTHGFERSVRKYCDHAFRFHDLRHYQASILTALGCPDIYITARCGWETDSTLKAVYQHTMDEKRKEIENRIVGYFEENMPQQRTQHTENHMFS